MKVIRLTQELFFIAITIDFFNLFGWLVGLGFLLFTNEIVQTYKGKVIKVHLQNPRENR